MAKITFKGSTVTTSGELPVNGMPAPGFSLTGTDLQDVSLEQFRGKTLILNIFPSLDTSVCAMSVRRFNEELAKLDGTSVLCVSADLPFAHKRFCVSEGLENVENASVFRSPAFGKDYGLLMTDGPLKGLLARAVAVVDPDGKIVYSELVPEIAQEPDYGAALAAAAVPNL